MQSDAEQLAEALEGILAHNPAIRRPDRVTADLALTRHRAEPPPDMSDVADIVERHQPEERWLYPHGRYVKVCRYCKQEWGEDGCETVRLIRLLREARGA